MTWQISRSLVALFILGTFGQDIMFPDDDHPEHLSGSSNEPLTERVPIYIEGQCPPNMLSYPGDGNESIWECDCKQGFLYFPKNNSCYEAYKRGPCPVQQYVVLPPGEVIPKCVMNPCREDGLVSYNGTCHELRKVGYPCPPDSQLTVNETSFQLECTKIDVNWFILITAPTNRCPNGGRRVRNGQCRPTL